VSQRKQAFLEAPARQVDVAGKRNCWTKNDLDLIFPSDPWFYVSLI